MVANKAVWVDTSFLYALLDSSDAEHNHAVRTLKKKGNRPFYTSYDVRSESYTLCIMRLGWHAAQDAMTLCNQVCSKILFSDAATWRAASEYSKWEDQTFSMVDCLSFAWMKKCKLTQFVGYDAHFRTARFSPFE
jgi:predicted nucleic acid-binding protein